MVGFAAGAHAAPPRAGAWTRRLAYAFAAAMAAANLLMVSALLLRDFSVSYVAHVGSRSVPDWVSVVSLWSSLEGSILFWGLILGAYIAVATCAQPRAACRSTCPTRSRVWLACGAFFSFLLAGPAQPFGTRARRCRRTARARTRCCRTTCS